ncbi:MAG: hypothetical protein AAFP19_18395, partial [Bacteroidota bacterium]
MTLQPFRHLAHLARLLTSHNPGTWAEQAAMAASGDWEKLKAWQDELDGGKVVKSSSSEEE